tara:strand:+ start:758 stop:1348 length:591 start_codon:yes stop_codon:yes gene_type:complete
MDLFTTYIQIDQDESVADAVLEPCKSILTNIPEDDRYKFGKTSYYNDKIWQEYHNKFKILYDFIYKNAFAYCEKLQILNIEKINIESIWVSEMYKYGQHRVHGHSGYCDLSGTFYVHSEPNSANLVFHRYEFVNDPHGAYKFTEYNKYNSSEWYFRPEKGGILIWKSDLPHSVELNMSESRIAISFNLSIIKNEGS